MVCGAARPRVPAGERVARAGAALGAVPRAPAEEGDRRMRSAYWYSGCLFICDKILDLF